MELLTFEECQQLGKIRQIYNSEVGRGFGEEKLVQALGDAIALIEGVVKRYEGPEGIG